MDNNKLFAGHIGSLTDSQTDALATFKEMLIQDGLYQPESDTLKASPDDPTLVRFLRARRFDVHAAHKQFSSCEKWRQEHDIDRVYATFDPDEMHLARTFYPRWTGRRDKNGIPLYVYKISSLKTRYDELHAVPSARRYQRIVMLYECMLRQIFPLCSDLPRRISPIPISSATSIIDLDGVSLSMLWNFRSHLQTASTLATANYPETLHYTIVVNSPSFFPTVWKWVQAWFDEGTRAKIKVLGKNPIKELFELIDTKDIPECYGGELHWAFDDEPLMDDDAKNLLGDRFPAGPWIWNNETVVTRARQDGRLEKEMSRASSPNDKPQSGDNRLIEQHAAVAEANATITTDR